MNDDRRYIYQTPPITQQAQMIQLMNTYAVISISISIELSRASLGTSSLVYALYRLHRA